MELWAGEKS